MEYMGGKDFLNGENIICERLYIILIDGRLSLWYQDKRLIIEADFVSF